MKGLCPFHEEKTPSFSVDPNAQLFYCFGCQTGGDVFKFIQLYDKAEFGEAVKTLAQRFGLPLPAERERRPGPEDRLLRMNQEADRFYRSAPEVQRTLRARVAENANELARDGLPRKDFYLTGRVGDVGIALHAEGEQVVLTHGDGQRETVNLAATGRRREGSPEQELPQPLALRVSVESVRHDAA